MAKILVVDDDRDFTDISSSVLKRAGHEVSAAYNSKEGMQAVKDFKPEVIILDVMMEQPDDGFVMAQDLRRQGIKTPILMLTSINKVSGLQYGQDKDFVPVDAFEEKPLEPQTLLARVNELLKKKEG
jgi:DNA-binding response OmpR family regulator